MALLDASAEGGPRGIYDRSWYGRVLVERVEGFASVSEWTRAYDEINEFERDLVRWGAILLKFWVDVSPEEQLRRFATASKILRNSGRSPMRIGATATSIPSTKPRSRISSA